MSPWSTEHTESQKCKNVQTFISRLWELNFLGKGESISILNLCLKKLKKHKLRTISYSTYFQQSNISDQENEQSNDSNCKEFYGKDGFYFHIVFNICEDFRKTIPEYYAYCLNGNFHQMLIPGLKVGFIINGRNRSFCKIFLQTEYERNLHITIDRSLHGSFKMIILHLFQEFFCCWSGSCCHGHRPSCCNSCCSKVCRT